MSKAPPPPPIHGFDNTEHHEQPPRDFASEMSYRNEPFTPRPVDVVDVYCPLDCGYHIRVLPGAIEHNLRGHFKKCPVKDMVSYKLGVTAEMPQEARRATETPQETSDDVRPTLRPSWPLEADPEPQTILEEAAHLVDGPREAHYGHPYDDFSRAIGAFNALFTDYLKKPLEVRHWPLIHELTKISREINEPKRDNWTDGAGYWRTLEKVFERMEQMNEEPSDPVSPKSDFHI